MNTPEYQNAMLAVNEIDRALRVVAVHSKEGTDCTSDINALVGASYCLRCALGGKYFADKPLLCKVLALAIDMEANPSIFTALPARAMSLYYKDYSLNQLRRQLSEVFGDKELSSSDSALMEAQAVINDLRAKQGLGPVSTPLPENRNASLRFNALTTTIPDGADYVAIFEVAEHKLTDDIIDTFLGLCHKSIGPVGNQIMVCCAGAEPYDGFITLYCNGNPLLIYSAMFGLTATFNGRLSFIGVKDTFSYSIKQSCGIEMLEGDISMTSQMFCNDTNRLVKEYLSGPAKFPISEPELSIIIRACCMQHQGATLDSLVWRTKRLLADIGNGSLKEIAQIALRLRNETIPGPVMDGFFPAGSFLGARVFCHLNMRYKLNKPSLGARALRTLNLTGR